MDNFIFKTWIPYYQRKLFIIFIANHIIMDQHLFCFNKFTIIYQPLMSLLILAVTCLSILSLGEAQVAYTCGAAFCQSCAFYDFCGKCQNNFLLVQRPYAFSQNYCAQLICDIANCQTCYQNYTCYRCKHGHYLNMNRTCSTGQSQNCSTNCISCSESQCFFCAYGYSLQNNLCFPTQGNKIKHCQAYFSSTACQLCQNNYMLDIGYGCVPIPTFYCDSYNYCIACVSADNCTLCLPGFVPNASGFCTPTNITNCSIIQDSNDTICLQCNPGFQLVDNKTCLQKVYYCNISNCVYCSLNNTCAQCLPGYTPQFIYFGTPPDNYYGIDCIAIVSLIPEIANCLQYGEMIYGTSDLQFGCITCQQGFIKVDGSCVVNITQSQYVCNIEFCVYCIYDNACGKCEDGYTVFIGTIYQCTPNHSPLPNCLLASYLNTSCQVCSEKYVLVEGLCILPAQNITCKVQGCNFCVLNNVCYECSSCYELDDETGLCIYQCNDSSCFQCGQNYTCIQCNIGYYWDVDLSECKLADNQPQWYCQQTFGINCTSCSFYTCEVCSDNYVVNTYGLCCRDPQPNIANCAYYSVTWLNNSCNYTLSCTKCSLGSFVLQYSVVPQCIKLPCSIQNCDYCFQSLVCILCDDGYNLVDGNCQNYTLPPTCTASNCVRCRTNTNQCLQCLHGYLLFNQTCICPFQNCLQCLSSAYCTKCASPTTTSFYGSQPQCVPSIVSSTLCTIPNCMNCISVNICGKCNNGFTLQSDSSCLINICDIPNNCSLCSSNQKVCYLCKPGYIQKTIVSSSCIPISQNYSCSVDGCTLCSQSEICQACYPFFELVNGSCIPFACVNNCILCLASNSCLICDIGYVYSTDSTCILQQSKNQICDIKAANISNCVVCANLRNSTQNQTAICLFCNIGLQPSADQLSCVPQTCSVSGCAICMQHPNPGLFNSSVQLCLICSQGYTITSYFQCTKTNSIQPPTCTDQNNYNCLYCGYDRSCDFCAPGWNPLNGSCLTSKFCNVINCQLCIRPAQCFQCIQNYQLNSDINECLPICNISFCQFCGTFNTCRECKPTFIIDQNQTCSCPNNLTLINEICQCSQGQILYHGYCYNCSVSFCIDCSQNDFCADCFQTFELQINGTCACPGNLSIINNDHCGCQIGYTQFQTQCISCNISYCSLCVMEDICTNCQQTFIFNGSECVCPFQPYQIINDTCRCPTNMTIYNQSCIICTVPYCQNCSSQDQCSTCFDTFMPVMNNSCQCPQFFSLYNSVCYNCKVSFCSECHQTNFCFRCNDTFIATLEGACACPMNTTLYGNTCVTCNIANCATCNSTNNCYQCDAFYTLYNGGCVPCSINFCTLCQSPNFCSICDWNYSANSKGDTCITCFVSQCMTCVSNYTCTTCISRYSLSKDSQYCYHCDILGCTSCSSDNVCQSCLTGYFLNGSQCSLCLYPCATCSSPTTCLTCRYPFSEYPFNGLCYACNVPNCLSCQYNYPDICSKCQPPYSTISCSPPCSTYCTNCLFNVKCLSCQFGYAVSPVNDYDCIQCTANNCRTCSSTNPSTCIKCADGYYTTNGTCQICPFSNCQTCNITSCFSFKQNLNQIPITIKGQIYATQCDPGCANCSNINPEICINCAAGYTPSSITGMCIPCSSPCLTCEFFYPSICLSCIGNMVLSGGTCQNCNSNNSNNLCLTCNEPNSDICTSCPTSSFLNGSTCIENCPIYCLNCILDPSSSSVICLICISGYSANSFGQCVPCLYNCRVCSGSNQSKCRQCGFGFYLSLTSAQCQNCPTNCAQCNFNGCLNCFQGYYITQNFACTPVCVTPCASCIDGQPQSCTSCLAGYTLNSADNSCYSQITCPDICYVCPLGCVLNGLICQQCNALNCGRCNISQTQTCVICNQGYYLDNYTCQQCSPGCKSCSNQMNCMACSSGYALISQPVFSNTYCTACQKPCAECIGNSQTCTSCVSGYTMLGWNCIATFNFGFSIILQATSATFFSNYYDFLMTLISPMDTTKFGNITITSIQAQTEEMLQLQIDPQTSNITNNMTVTGNISATQPSNSSGVRIQYLALTAVLKNQTIAGMPILSYTLNPNNGVIPPEPIPPVPPGPTPDPIEGPSTLSIILGITIPFGIVLIGVLFYCFVVKKKSQPSQSQLSSQRRSFQLTKQEEIL